MKMKNATVTQDRVKQLLHYDPDTGEFRWATNRSPQAKRGQIAGTLNRYRFIMIDSRLYGAHRLAWLYMTGEFPRGEIDHCDLDKDNNKWANLRLATRAQNVANCRVRKDNKVGLKGVTLHKPTGKYRAQITINKDKRHLGLFNTAVEAHRAYVRVAKAENGQFARTS